MLGASRQKLGCGARRLGGNQGENAIKDRIICDDLGEKSRISVPESESLNEMNGGFRR